MRSRPLQDFLLDFRIPANTMGALGGVAVAKLLDVGVDPAIEDADAVADEFVGIVHDVHIIGHRTRTIVCQHGVHRALDGRHKAVHKQSIVKRRMVGQLRLDASNDTLLDLKKLQVNDPILHFFPLQHLPFSSDSKWKEGCHRCNPSFRLKTKKKKNGE